MKTLELEEMLKLANNTSIRLAIICNNDGSLDRGRYNIKTEEITLNPCQSKKEFGLTFIHELYHHWANLNNVRESKILEENHAETYAIKIYNKYSKDIDKYLINRGLT